MNNTQITTDWIYPTTGCTMSREGMRHNVQPPNAYALTGVEAQVDGGLRPFSGFKEAYRFQVTSLWGVGHNSTSEIVDLFVKDMVIGSSYGLAIVYRVRRQSVAGVPSSTCDIFLDYFNANNRLWIQSTRLYEGVPLPPEDDPISGAQMSVSVFGRFVYVFVEGQEPLAFWVKETGHETSEGTHVTTEMTYGLVIQRNTGPGKQPTLLSPRIMTELGAITTTGDPNRGGAGGVFLTQYGPSEIPLGIYPTGTPHQEYAGIRSLKPGDYAFAYVLYDPESGRRSSLSQVAEVRRVEFAPEVFLTTGSASFTPHITTGHDTVLSSMYAVLELVWDASVYSQAYVYRSVQVQDAGGTYVASILHLDNILDLTEFKTANESSVTDTATGTDLQQAIYYYALEDKQLVFQDTFLDRTLFDEQMPFGGASLWYENTMLVSKIKGGQTRSATERNRPGDELRGLGEIRWSSVPDVSPELYPPENRYVPTLPSNSVVVFKQIGPNAIGFSKDRQYHFRKEGSYMKVQELHEGFGVTSSKAADTVASLVYFVSNKGIKAVDTNAQLDDVRTLNSLIIEEWADTLDYVSVAFDPVVGVLCILNPATEEMGCLWFNTANTTMVKDVACRTCVRGSWPLNLEFTEGSVNWLLQEWASESTRWLNPLGERVLFVKNTPDRALHNAEAYYSLMVIDHRREKAQTSGEIIGTGIRHSLFPVSGDAIWTLQDAYTTSGQAMRLQTNTMGGPGYTKVINPDTYGLKMYVLKAANPLLVGRSLTIRSAVSLGILHRYDVFFLEGDTSEFIGLQAGDIVGISPVYFEWQGYPVTAQTNEGVPFQKPDDYFTVKHVRSMGCAFTNVGGNALLYPDLDTDASSEVPTGNIARYQGLVYRGQENEPASIGDTRDTSGNLVRSVVENEATYWAAMGDRPSEGTRKLRGRFGASGSVLTPGVRLFCPDLDFELMGVMVRGEVMATVRTGKSS